MIRCTPAVVIKYQAKPFLWHWPRTLYRRFKYITIRNGFLSSTLANSKVIVREIKSIGISFGNGYVDIVGHSITLKDGISERIILHIAFDRAIENSPALPPVRSSFRMNWNTRP